MKHSEQATKAVSAGTRNHTDDPAAAGSLKKISSLYAVSFLFLATAVVGVIWHDLRADYLNTLAYWNVQLSSSAEERVRVSALWLKERRTDTVAIAENPSTIHLLSAGGGKSQVEEIRQQVEREIAHIASVNGFLGGAVRDSDCRIMAQTGLRPEMAEGAQDACRLVQQTGEYRIDTLGRDQGHVWLNFSAPVMTEGRASSSAPVTRRIVGSVVMVAENWQDFLLVFGTESVPTQTSETLVVWQKASEAFIFSPRLSARGVASFFRRPLAASTFESRVARNGNVAFGEFIDYRGVRVFGAARRIAEGIDSVASKVDRDEALSAYHRHRTLDWLAGALALLLLGSVMVAQHRNAAARDFAEKARQQEALRESEAKLREALLAAQMGVWEWTLATNTVTWDENIYRITGRDPKLPAPAYEEHPQIFTPESWERLKTGVENALATGTPYELDLELVRLDGSQGWLIGRGEPLRDARGHIAQLRGTVQDITDRKRTEESLRESEERFRTIFENAGVGMALVDLEGHPLKTNPALRQMLGYREEEFSRMVFTEFTYPDDQELDWKLYGELAAGKRDKYEIEKRYLKKGGGVVWGLLVVSLIKDPHGRPVYCVGMVEDITERKRAEEELQRSFHQLRALAARLQSIREEERKKVAREIHDQLGQALTAIKIDLSALVRDLAADKKQRSQSVLNLIDQTIQSVRRISTELRPGILDDLGLVAAVEWAAEEFESRTGTKCRLELPEDELAVDSEQATAIFRIFQETLTNVARHSQANQVIIRLAPENGDLTLQVSDNGKGVSEGQISGRGSLGILGMRERTILLGGELTIGGAPGQGTTVKVRIPAPHCAQKME